VRQVVINLLSNAVKFTERGEIRLRVRAANGKSPRHGQRQLEICVRDSGIGIPTQRLSGIFDAFTQADASTTRRFGGTGLGLSICRELVRLMGGEIWAHSAPGEGSSFYFSLNLPIATDDASDAAALAGLRGHRLLALGDSATSRQLLDALAHQPDVDSVRCESESALLVALQVALQEDVAEGQAVDALLLDMSGPNSGILDLARRLSAQLPRCRRSSGFWLWKMKARTGNFSTFRLLRRFGPASWPMPFCG